MTDPWTVATLRAFEREVAAAFEAKQIRAALRAVMRGPRHSAPKSAPTSPNGLPRPVGSVVAPDFLKRDSTMVELEALVRYVRKHQ